MCIYVHIRTSALTASFTLISILNAPTHHERTHTQIHVFLGESLRFFGMF